MTAPGWAKHLKGVDPKSVNSRAALAKLPVLRKSDVAALQKENPPFGGLNVTAPGKARRLLMSPGPIFEPEGEGKDWWGSARALLRRRLPRRRHRAQFLRLSPHARRLHSGSPGCHALGCAVIPGGVGNTEQQLEAIAHYKPSGYVGTPDFLKILLDTAEKTGKDAASIKRALVSGAALPASLRDELGKRGVAVLQCYATAELGVIAYESESREGMIVNESVIVEIVRPGTGDPVAEGEVGEVVVTSFNPDYPMIRLGTGDLSALMPGASPCGRTNNPHQGLDGPRRSDRQGQGHVRASQADRRGRRAPSRNQGLGLLVGPRRQLAHDADGGMRWAREFARGRGRRHVAVGHQAQRRGQAGRAGRAAE